MTVARRIVVLCGAMIALVTFVPRSRAATSAVGSLDSLRALIETRRLAADYAGAARVAEEITRLTRLDRNARQFEVVNADWQLRTLRHLASLPLSTRLEMARSDSVGKTLPDWFSDQQSRESLVKGSYRIMVTRKCLGEDYPEITDVMSDLAVRYIWFAEFDSAETLQHEQLAITRRLLGEDHPDFGRTLVNMGALATLRGDHVQAEALYRSSLDILGRTLGPEDRELANSLHNLSVTLDRQGDYREAEALARDADRRRMSPGMTMHLAQVLLLQGKVAEADSTASACWDAWYEKPLLGPGGLGPWLAGPMATRADIAEARGDRSGAFAWRQRKLDFIRTTRPPTHPDVATSLMDVAEMYIQDARYTEAEPLLREALGVNREALDQDHPALARNYLLLGRLEYASGRLVQAEPDFERAAASYDLARVRVATGMKRATSRLESPYRELALTRLALSKQDSAWDAAERGQARTLADLLISSGGHHTRGADASPLDAVQSFIEPDMALMGWVQSDERRRGARPEAWGYVIRHEGPVQWSELPASSDAAAALRAELASASGWGVRVPSSPRLAELGRALYDARIAPLAAGLDGIRKLVVIPSGDMLGIPIEILCEPDGHWLADRVLISYAPSATTFAWILGRPREGSSHVRPALLVGDPPFNGADLKAMRKETRKKRSEGYRTSEELAWSGDLAHETLYRDAVTGNDAALNGLPRLPMSRKEIMTIAEAFPGAKVLVGPDASEHNLRAMAASGELGRYRLIHVATHALMNDAEPENSALALSRVDLPDATAAARSGNRVEDGLLTAREIVKDWRLDADLVALSGCRTALGREVPGEGYLGFAHAMFQAGARCLLVSLWKVDDAATALFMQRFYEAYARNDSPAAAIAAARRDLREFRSADGAQPFAHPVYWSGFVLIGDAY